VKPIADARAMGAILTESASGLLEAEDVAQPPRDAAQPGGGNLVSCAITQKA
jgi:hypothetical protein